MSDSDIVFYQIIMKSSFTNSRANLAQRYIEATLRQSKHSHSVIKSTYELLRQTIMNTDCQLALSDDQIERVFGINGEAIHVIRERYKIPYPQKRS